MPGFSRGQLNFDRIHRGTTESAEQAIAILDCAPPPRGSRQAFNPPVQWPAELLPAFIQPSELNRIVAGAATPQGPNDPGFILVTMMASLGFRPLDIDLKQVPAGWDQVTACMRTTISYSVESDIYDIDVTAAADVTLAGETYPTGDRVASIRVHNPRRYRFIRRFEHNPGCCEGYHVVPATEQSDWFPENQRDVIIYLGPDYQYNWGITPKYKFNLYEPEGLPRPGTDDSLRREIEELNRKLRELQEKLQKMIEGGGH